MLFVISLLQMKTETLGSLKPNYVGSLRNDCCLQTTEARVQFFVHSQPMSYLMSNKLTSQTYFKI